MISETVITVLILASLASVGEVEADSKKLRIVVPQKVSVIHHHHRSVEYAKNYGYGGHRMRPYSHHHGSGSKPCPTSHRGHKKGRRGRYRKTSSKYRKYRKRMPYYGRKSYGMYNYANKYRNWQVQGKGKRMRGSNNPKHHDNHGHRGGTRDQDFYVEESRHVPNSVYRNVRHGDRYPPERNEHGGHYRGKPGPRGPGAGHGARGPMFGPGHGPRHEGQFKPDQDRKQEEHYPHREHYEEQYPPLGDESKHEHMSHYDQQHTGSTHDTDQRGIFMHHEHGPNFQGPHPLIIHNTNQEGEFTHHEHIPQFDGEEGLMDDGLQDGLYITDSIYDLRPPPISYNYDYITAQDRFDTESPVKSPVKSVPKPEKKTSNEVVRGLPSITSTASTPLTDDVYMKAFHAFTFRRGVPEINTTSIVSSSPVVPALVSSAPVERLGASPAPAVQSGPPSPPTLHSFTSSVSMVGRDSVASSPVDHGNTWSGVSGQSPWRPGGLVEHDSRLGLGETVFHR